MIKRFYTAVLLIFFAACAHFYQADGQWIKNAQGEKIYLKIDGMKNLQNKKLAFIQHGLASNMEHQAVQTVKKAFLDNGYVVVTFDSRYSLGRSGNDVLKVQLATFRDDLQTVTDFAKTQPFYSEPFALAGHSLGGASVIQYAADNPQKVSKLIPITPVISGQLWEETCMANMTEFCRQWKKSGVYEYTDMKNHKVASIPYSVVTSSLSYNACQLMPKVKAKTLIIGAQDDIIIAPSDITKLSQTSVIIPQSGHNFEEEQNQTDLYNAIDKFLK